jgi:hypothetical protein
VFVTRVIVHGAAPGEAEPAARGAGTPGSFGDDGCSNVDCTVESTGCVTGPPLPNRDTATVQRAAMRFLDLQQEPGAPVADLG